MARRGLGHLTELVAFDAPTEAADAFGGTEDGWAEQFRRRAEFTYQRGSETVEAARWAGRNSFKVRVAASSGTRDVTTDWRLRDVRRSASYNIREIDAITDRRWIYLVVEGPVS